MKLMRIIVIALLCTTFFNVNAQTEKGKFSLSGSSDLSAFFKKREPSGKENTTNDSKIRDYNFAVGAGYFVADNLNIGISADYRKNYNKFFLGVSIPEVGFTKESYSETKSQELTIGPSVRYFFPVSEKIRPFLHAGVGYSSNKNSNRIVLSADRVPAEIPVHFNGFSLDGRAGVSWFLNKAVSLDLGLQFLQQHMKNKKNREDKYTANNFGASIGIAVYL